MENNSRVSDQPDSRFPYLNSKSFHYHQLESHSPRSINDRRFAFSRQTSFHQSTETNNPNTPRSSVIISNDSIKPLLSRTASSIDIPPPSEAHERESVCREDDHNDLFLGEWNGVSGEDKFSVSSFAVSGFRIMRTGNRVMKRLLVLIFLNVAYSTAELFIGLVSGRVGLVSDAFHLTFGCGLLTFSLFAMDVSRNKADRIYTYGYKRLEVLSAFTNALFLLFMSFSLAVEALHAFIQDESEHKHYLIVSAVTNLLVNLIGVWFFRNYARVNLVYRKAEDMNYHSVCLHVLADSIRSAGLILASWLLTLGVKNAEVLCLGLVSVTVFMLVMPLFKATGGVLLQMAPPSIPSSALSKCLRQVKTGMADRPILQYVHGLYHDLGVQQLTVQTDYA
ncbi:hypothetical protein RHGRI_006239 [Rhododendron griersonianum]|uniref:Cation efflux protein transmembrane domain-containing protein n=1 Tax=Rhododendron griersonianum TaxID=479676 RepID=A0AAV6KTE6_9ERIC|nr:hypothetical protein RHGRI_006239 [Rhododendron griersonianum]